jgi:hypothetical protein
MLIPTQGILRTKAPCQSSPNGTIPSGRDDQMGSWPQGQQSRSAKVDIPIQHVFYADHHFQAEETADSPDCRRPDTWDYYRPIAQLIHRHDTIEDDTGYDSMMIDHRHERSQKTSFGRLHVAARTETSRHLLLHGSAEDA